MEAPPPDDSTTWSSARHALIITNSAYDRRVVNRKGQAFQPLHDPTYHGERMREELEWRGFDVWVLRDKARVPLLHARDAFVAAFRSRLKSKTFYGSETETLVVYYSGHGVLTSKAAYKAVTIDATYLDLHKEFTLRLNAVDPEGGHTIIAISDVHLGDVIISPDTQQWIPRSLQKPGDPPLFTRAHVEEDTPSARSTSETPTENHIVMAFACLPGPCESYEPYESYESACSPLSSWAQALVKAMGEEDDKVELIAMLRHISETTSVVEAGLLPLVLVQPGGNCTCWLPRPQDPRDREYSMRMRCRRGGVVK